MKKLIFGVVGIMLLGCGKKEEKPQAQPVVDNSMTRYVEGLQSDVAKARDAANKFNEATKKREADVQPPN